MSYLEKLRRLSLADAWQYLADPPLLFAHLQAPAASTLTQAVQAVFPGADAESIERYKLEYLGNHRFFEQINEKMLAKRSRRAIPVDWLQLIYVLVRLKQPETIVETGVFDGESSATYLLALHENKKGLLVSVDLPAVGTIDGSTQQMRETTLPSGCQPGWVIPDGLRDRHELILGDCRELLPQVFEKHPRIDIFMHDSLHTYEHQLFEYRTAWPHLAPGGVLLSDDIFWNAAFPKFCKEIGRSYKHFSGFGVLV